MLFKPKSERRRAALVDSALALAGETANLTNVQLRLEWTKLKNAVAQASAKKRDKALLSALPRALALAREAAKRALGLSAFPVQLAGATVLADGQVAEMRTGEGKTLVAAIGAALGTLRHAHVHVVTANEYLAARDAAAMAPFFAQLGVTSSVTLNGHSPGQKKASYASEVLYAVNSELGFDYLRDNMVMRLEDAVQPPLHETLAVIDEADAILIDEARTPLIITQQSDESVSVAVQAARFVEELVEGEDFEVDRKQRQAHFTEVGYERAEKWLQAEGYIESPAALYASVGLQLLHRLHAALRARTLYKRDEHYLVTEGKVVIVDEGTGRPMPERRWSEGLHQAVEAREGLKVQSENETLASVTYQHFFSLYGARAGLTGTAWGEREELETVYGLLVVRVPTNRPVIRKDLPDRIYRTKAEKYRAIVEDVKTRAAKGQPVLLGTPSVEVSETLSALLSEQGVRHHLLNARRPEQEATIIAEAGRLGAVTVATNMAGRGTDILLGGSLERALSLVSAELPQEERAAAELVVREAWAKERQQVLDTGGLYVLGAERNESRRIDDQLRGRSGRQGDPGESRFYLSLEDELLRVFGAGFTRLASGGLAEGEALEHGLLTRAVAKAQKKRESLGYDQRKNLLKFDVTPAAQRDAYYGWRRSLLEDDGNEIAAGWLLGAFDDVAEAHLLADIMPEMVATAPLVADFADIGWELSESEVRKELDAAESVSAYRAHLLSRYEAFIVQRLAVVLSAGQSLTEALLTVADSLWRKQEDLLADLRDGIHLQAYAQQDPSRAYVRISTELFESMLVGMRHEFCRVVAALEAASRLAAGGDSEDTAETVGHLQEIEFDGEAVRPVAPSSGPTLRISRNAACPCGSGKRYKHCHGALRTALNDVE